MNSDKQKNKVVDLIFLRYLKFLRKIKYDIESCKEDSIILHFHLGLGDNIICNGLVNKISNSFKEIHLPIKEKYSEMIRFMFKSNKNIKFFDVSYSNSTNDVYKYSIKNNLDVLRIGFEKQKNEPFNTWFYNQIKFDYIDSYDYFDVPKDSKKSNQLFDHLTNYYEIGNNPYNLIHNESHENIYELKILNNFKNIYVSKNSDVFNNLFFYDKVIEKAQEIHCINSSFLHLVDRLPNKKNLFYHKVRHSNFFIDEKWKIIEY